MLACHPPPPKKTHFQYIPECIVYGLTLSILYGFIVYCKLDIEQDISRHVLAWAPILINSISSMHSITSSLAYFTTRKLDEQLVSTRDWTDILLGQISGTFISGIRLDIEFCIYLDSNNEKLSFFNFNIYSVIKMKMFNLFCTTLVSEIFVFKTNLNHYRG